MSRIDEQLKQDILLKTNIVDIIGEYVSLKKSGDNFFALCPFHNEKTPSFSISQKMQIFNCFGCGKKGDVIQFLIEHNNISFVDAVKALASRLGIEIKLNNNYEPDGLSELYDCMHLANYFFQLKLRENKNNRAVSYCNKRGISGKIAQNYCLGYAPDSWNELKNFLLSRKIDLNIIEQVGLIKIKDSNSYDRFRDRLIFPIKNTKGQVIGFGGRVLDEKNQPKYLNSPETKIFSKGKTLYGLYEAKQNNLDYILITEGYTDVVSLSQAGIHNAVASLGTSVTEDQVKEAFRYTKKIIFCLDGDKAGQEAAWRALQVSLPLMDDGKVMKFLFMDDNFDPDSFIKKNGAEKFKEKINKAIPLSEYILQKVASSIDNVNTIDGKSSFVSNIKPILNKMPDSVFKTMIVNNIEKMTGLSADTLNLDKAKNISKNNYQPVKKKKSKQEIINPPAMRILAAILKDKKYLDFIDDCTLFDKLDIIGANLLSIVFNLLRENSQYELNELKAKIPVEFASEFIHAVKRSQQLDAPEDDIRIDILDALKKIKLYCYDEELEKLFIKVRISKATDSDKRKILDLLSEKTELNKTND